MLKEITNSAPALTDETFEALFEACRPQRERWTDIPWIGGTVGGTTESGARGETTVYLGDERSSPGVYVK